MHLLNMNIAPRAHHDTRVGRHVRATATAMLLALGLSAGQVQAAAEIITDVFNPMTWGQQMSSPTISGDGRYIAYRHYDGSKTNINLYDRIAGTTQQINLTPTGAPSTGGTESPVISADGRFIVYSSRAPDMGVPKGGGAYFVYDRINKTTETVVTGTGSQIFGQTYAAISSDGHYVAYRIVDGNLNSKLYVRDMVSKTTQVASATTTFIVNSSDRMFVSDNGRYISYRGKEKRDDNRFDLLLHDRATGTTELLNINTAGERENIPNGPLFHSMNSDGSVVAFSSFSKNLSPNDLAANMDVFVRDRKAGTTERISGLSTNPVNYGNSGNFGPSVSADGRFVSYFGQGKASTSPGLYQFDRATKIGRRAILPNNNSAILRYPIISAGGRYVVYDFFYGNRPDTYLIGTTDFGAVSGLTLSSKTLALTEGGAAATYTAVLDQEPSADVQVGVAPDAQLSVARPQLTFTPANWATPQTVSVQAVADGVVEGRHSGTVLHTVNSADPAYTVVPAARVTVAITDTVVPTIAAPATWAQPDLPVHGTAAPGATVLLSAVNLAGGGVTAVSVV
ncbi:WD40-like Beta Propeller Repeat, partial [Rugamonas rubra]